MVLSTTSALFFHLPRPRQTDPPHSLHTSHLHQQPPTYTLMKLLSRGRYGRTSRPAQSAGDIQIGDSISAMLEDSSESPIEEETTKCNEHVGNGSSPQPHTYLLLNEQIHRMITTQEETARAISNMNASHEETARALVELNTAIRDLCSAVQNDTKAPQAQAPRAGRRLSDKMTGSNTWRVSTPLLSEPRRRSDGISELDDSTSDESAVGNDMELDRKQARLDGLEVYAVVSAVTAGTLVAVFDSYHPGDIVDLFMEGRYLEVIMSAVFLATGTLGIVCGLHCIFVFSLVTMYGRTALGMERDEALEICE